MTRPTIIPSGSIHAFADELVKVAGVGSIGGMLERLVAKGKSSGAGKTLKTLVDDLKRSPAHRKAVLHSGLLGAGTGAAGAIASGGDESAWKRGLRGGIGGGVAGAATGAFFPAWFTGANRRLR